MARMRYSNHVGNFTQIPNNLRRSPRFQKQNDVFELQDVFRNHNLSDTNSLPDPKTPYMESLARLSSKNRSLMSLPSSGYVMVNVDADEVRQNEEVTKSFVSKLRRSPRFGKSCVEQIIGPNTVASGKKSGAQVKGSQENARKERVCLRRSPRFSNQPINYKDADQKLDSVLDTICGIDGGKSDRLVKKIIRNSNSTIRSDKESLQPREEASLKNEVISADAGKKKKKRKRAKEGNVVVRGWTKEQEILLERAYMTMKPTPCFWKKVSKMVGKSAQECFDRINCDVHTPVPPRIRSRLKKKMSPPMSGCSLSASKLLVSPSQKPTRKRKTHLGQKKVRELLQKQCNIETDYKGDLFSVLEANLASSPIKVSQQTPLSFTPLAVSLSNGSNSFSTRKKCVSRVGKGALLVSPPVLKQVKNKVLHEKYIDQLHIREAKRKAELTRANKSTFGKENLAPSCNQKANMVQAAKNALESDARDVILQFRQVQAKALDICPSESEEGIPLSSDETEDEL